MKVTYEKTDLLENPAARNALVSIINDAVHGGFMVIHGFKSKTGHGEIQDATYCKGISYENAKQNSLAILDEIEADEGYSITVTRGVWANDKGEVNPTGRKSKAYPNPETRTETYDKGHPILGEAFAKVRKSLTKPEPPTKEYKKLGNGVYEDEETGTLYVRDLRLVDKRVIVHGDYPHKAGAEVNAVADAIKRTMPIGNYRMFRLDAEYKRLSLGGNELAPAEQTEAVEGKVEAKRDEIQDKAKAKTPEKTE
jgi:hypothetical protein